MDNDRPSISFQGCTFHIQVHRNEGEGEEEKEQLRTALTQLAEHCEAIEANAAMHYESQTRMHPAHRALFIMFQEAGAAGVRMARTALEG